MTAARRLARLEVVYRHPAPAWSPDPLVRRLAAELGMTPAAVVAEATRRAAALAAAGVATTEAMHAAVAAEFGIPVAELAAEVAWLMGERP